MRLPRFHTDRVINVLAELIFCCQVSVGKILRIIFIDFSIKESPAPFLPGSHCYFKFNLFVLIFSIVSLDCYCNAVSYMEFFHLGLEILHSLDLNIIDPGQNITRLKSGIFL